MQENFLHTSVKCCTSAGKFPTHTVKIWIFLSSAGNMTPVLQPPNTGALRIIISYFFWNMFCTLTRPDSSLTGLHFSLVGPVSSPVGPVLSQVGPVLSQVGPDSSPAGLVLSQVRSESGRTRFQSGKTRFQPAS